MTDAQREAAWLALRSVYGRSSMDADRALHALTDAGYLLLHRDDARAVQTFLDAYDAYMVGSVSRRTFGPMVEARSALRSQWEPIPRDASADPSPADIPLNQAGEPRVKVAESGCWEWQMELDRDGYGRIQAYGNRSVLAHRWVYELLVGQIPEGLTIDHLCRNRPCVNPAHLDPVTHAENMRRAVAARAGAESTHCRNGHEYTPENTLFTSRGHRKCRTCLRANKRRADAKRLAAKRNGSEDNNA